MRALGHYLLSNKIQSIIAVSFLTVMAAIFQPFSYFLSGVPIGFITLRKGATTGGQIAAGSLLLLSVIAILLQMQPILPALVMLFVWLPVILCASVLRATQSQGLMMLGAGVVGVLFAIYTHITIEHLYAWWELAFEQLKASNPLGFTPQQFMHIDENMPPLLSALILFGFMMCLITSMLLSRWWQSVLFRPGGFREEFYALRLPRALAFPLLLGIGVLLFSETGASLFLRDIFIVLMALYLFQGLASLHRFVHDHGLSRGWLTAMYVLFFLLPHVMVFVACVGIVASLSARAGDDKERDQ